MGNEEVDPGHEDEGEALESRKKRILGEIIDVLVPQPIQEDEFTVDDFLQELEERGKPMTRRKAYGLLAKAKENGLLTGRKIPINGMQTWVLRPAGSSSNESSEQ